MDLAEAADAVPQGVGEDVRAVALISLGEVELAWQRLDEAERHLEQGIAVARRIGRPYTEVIGLAHGARVAAYRSLALAVERGTQAIELARQHGWAEHPVLSAAYTLIATVMIWRGRFDEGERWLRDAEGTLRTEAEPATSLLFHQARGTLELARGRYDDALAAFRAAGKHAELLVSSHPLRAQPRALTVYTLLRAGDIQSAEQDLAEMDEQQRQDAEMREAVAALRLAQDDPQAALEALAPVLHSSGSVIAPARVGACLLEAIARDTAGDRAAAENALERALDLAEPDGIVMPFLIHRAPELLERHSRRRTTHAALVAKIRSLLALGGSDGPGRFEGTGEAWGNGHPPQVQGASWEDRPPEATLAEPLSEMEMRVLRFLPTNLKAAEIAGELYLSVHTVKTHIRHIYAKLGVHGRGEAVRQARALGLLAPSPRRR